MSTTFCPRCDSKSPPGTAVCPNCGLPLTAGTMMMGKLPNVPRPQVTFRIVRADGGPEIALAMKANSLLCGRVGEIALHDDPFVAENQARFFFSGARLAVEDIGGGNGLFSRLRQDRDLLVGGELRLGRQRLVVEPIPSLAASTDGSTAFGSPDEGYRFRLIQILEGGVRGAAFPLKDGDNAVGREHGDVAFPSDGFVSGRHALLRVAGDRLTVKDLGSSNGTFIRLSAPAFVENGDQFLVGRQLIRVEVTEAV